MDQFEQRATPVKQLVRIEISNLPKLVTAAGDRAGLRFLEFFAVTIRNPHTRRAYSRAVGEFLAWWGDAIERAGKHAK